MDLTGFINTVFHWLKPGMMFGLMMVGAMLTAQESTDTILFIRQLKEQGKTKEASQLLETWVKTHPPQSDVFWMYAQNEYWRKKFKKSRSLYAQAYELDPGNLYLRLDYAHSLLNMGRYKKANRILKQLSPEEQKDPYAMYVGAKRLFWSGDVKAANQLAGTARDAGSKDATSLVQDTKNAMAPWMRLALAYGSDSQPLENLAPSLEVGVFSSKWVDLQVVASPQKFYVDDVASNFFRAAMHNRFHIPQTGTSVGLSAGVFQPENGSFDWTGGVDVVQRLPAGWQLSAGWAQRPYLETRASIGSGFTFQQTKVEVHWQESHGFQANLFALSDVFADYNKINTFGGWLLSSPLVWWHFTMRAGYAYSFSDAFESRYVTDKTVEDVVNSPDPTAPISGSYNPYFTPEQMKIHSVLGVLDYRVTRFFSLGLQGKYGFAASANNPYLFLNGDTDGNVYIARDFENTAFTPFEYGGKLTFQITDHLVFTTSYLFSSLFFYDVQTAGGSLKMYF